MRKERSFASGSEAINDENAMAKAIEELKLRCEVFVLLSIEVCFHITIFFEVLGSLYYAQNDVNILVRVLRGGFQRGFN